MNKILLFVLVILLILCATLAYDSDESLGRKLFDILRRNNGKARYYYRSQYNWDDVQVESDSESACDSLKYYSDSDVSKLLGQIALSTNKLDDLKKGLVSLTSNSQAMLTGSQVEQFLKLFPVANKVAALKMLDPYFYVIDASNAVAILKTLTFEQLCSLGDFQVRILEATETSKRSCVFSKVDSSLVIFVIDVSPSMWYRYKNVARIDLVRQEFANVIKTLKPDQEFNLIVFGGEIVLWKQSPVKATEENTNEAIKYLNNRATLGATNINDSLEVALSKIPSTTKDATIFFLTDGVANAGKYWAANKIIDNITTLNHQRQYPVTINTISFLLGIQSQESLSVAESQAVTKGLAEKNGGVARTFAEK